MKTKFATTYLASWTLYAAFCFGMFPYLNITVMLFSIPLTMLGGWLYFYPGALSTVALTIPFHFIMLGYSSNDPSIAYQAFSPFGIGTQLCFSLSAVLLRKTQIRYENLNGKLETIIEERTKDLRLLTDYLIQVEDFDRTRVTAGLLESPLEQLNGMRRIGALLKQHLESCAHPAQTNVKKINQLIRSCIEQLSELADETHPTDNGTLLQDRLLSLITQIDSLSSGQVNLEFEGDWNGFDPPTAHHLYNIIHEAVTNAIKHANASRIRVGIESEAASRRVFVENDGTPLLQGAKEGMGLPLMRYRAQRIGGEISIDGSPGKRTIVQCILPATPSSYGFGG